MAGMPFYRRPARDRLAPLVRPAALAVGRGPGANAPSTAAPGADASGAPGLDARDPGSGTNSAKEKPAQGQVVAVQVSFLHEVGLALPHRTILRRASLSA